MADDIRYDDVTGGGFVLVTSAPLSPQQRTLLAGRGTEVLEVAPGSPLHTWLTDGNATAALVRPDFTVLRAGRDVAGLCEAAPKFLVARGTPPPLTPDLCALRSELRPDCRSTMKREIYDADHESFRASVRSLLDRAVKPSGDQYLEAKQLPREMWPTFGRQGLLGLQIPEQYAGSAAGDFRYNAVLGESSARSPCR